MTKVSNSLSGRLAEHIKLIAVLSECYDGGHEIVAVAIATAIRVLVHNTQNSVSLLTHLTSETVHLLSTNLREPSEKVHLGLIRRINAGVNDGKGGEAKYWPLCDERYFPSPRGHFVMLELDAWWNECVFENTKHRLTRRELVLAVTNKDGGAHFDAEVEECYDQFRKSWSGGSSLAGLLSGTNRGYDNIPIYPAIRQVAYELLHSGIDAQV
jgi:hypothetical protein